MIRLWIEVFLILVIVGLGFWIYYVRGWETDKKELLEEKEALKERIASLEQTNDTLRAGLSSTADRTARPLKRVLSIVEDLVRVREACLGSTMAREFIEDKYDVRVSPVLVKKILSSIDNVNPPLKRRLAHEVLVGEVGRTILRCVDRGDGLDVAASEAGVPLRMVKQKVKLLKETGYLNNQLNLTQMGSEAKDAY